MPSEPLSAQPWPPVHELGYADHLLVWALRRIVARRAACPVIVRAFADACGDEAAEVLATFRVFVGAVGHAARRRVEIGHPGWCGLTGSERQLLAFVAAAQDEDAARLDAHLRWLARAEARHCLRIAARALAAALAAHDLHVTAPADAAAVQPIAAISTRLVL